MLCSPQALLIYTYISQVSIGGTALTLLGTTLGGVQYMVNTTDCSSTRCAANAWALPDGPPTKCALLPLVFPHSLSPPPSLIRQAKTGFSSQAPFLQALYSAVGSGANTISLSVSKLQLYIGGTVPSAGQYQAKASITSESSGGRQVSTHQGDDDMYVFLPRASCQGFSFFTFPALRHCYFFVPFSLPNQSHPLYVCFMQLYLSALD